MRVVDDLAELERGTPAILTIGAFDGVHRGHQFLIRQVVDRARWLDYESVVISFDPRPQIVLARDTVQLTSAAEKTRLIGAIGVDVLVMVNFTTEFSKTSASQFLVSILDHVNVGEIWTGSDFVFGHNRAGNVDLLLRTAEHSGLAVHVLSRQPLDGIPISSTVVRKLIEAGEVKQAAVFLGHYMSVPGQVVKGHGRGRGLGFPTANIEPAPFQLLPATGIYAGYLRLDGQQLPAAVSVGYNPTFGGDAVRVEAHILDFDEDIHGRQASVDFVKHLRDERAFENVDALISEMQRDVENVRRALAKAEEPGELILQP